MPKLKEPTNTKVHVSQKHLINKGNVVLRCVKLTIVAVKKRLQSTCEGADIPLKNDT